MEAKNLEQTQTFKAKAVAQNNRQSPIDFYLEDGKIVFLSMELEWCKYETTIIENRRENTLTIINVNDKSFKVVIEVSKLLREILEQENFSVQQGQLNRGHKKNIRDLSLIAGILASVFLSFKLIPKYFHGSLSQETLQHYQDEIDEIYRGKLNFEPKDPRIIELKKICDQYLTIEDISQFQIGILESSTVNAYAMPINRIVITSELYKKAKTKPQLIASIIAHEIGHHYHKHIQQNIMEEEVESTVFMIFNGNIAAPANIARLSFSRDHEREAELIALKIMQRNNIDPKDIIEFHKMRGGSNIKALNWLSTHPPSEERAKLYQDYLDKFTLD